MQIKQLSGFFQYSLHCVYTHAHVYPYVFVYSSLTLEQRKHDFKNWVQNCMFMIYIRDLLVYRNKGRFFCLQFNSLGLYP